MGGDSSLKWLMGNAGVSLTLAKGSCECDDPDCSLRRDLSLQVRGGDMVEPSKSKD